MRVRESELVAARAPLLLVIVAGTLLPLLTRTDAVQIDDSSELVAAACNAGVPHPPGYPLFLLLGHGLCELPFSTPAGRVGLLSIVAGLASLLFVLALVRRTTRNDWAGALAALTLAAGSAFWRYASQAEVFTFHSALCLAVLYLSLRAMQATDAGRQLGWCGSAALCCGLALANHPSSVALTPAALLAMLLPWRSVGQAALRVLAGLAGLTIGLLPYLYLRYTSPTNLPRWGDTASWSGFVEHVLHGNGLSSQAALSSEPTGTGLQNLASFVARLPSQMAWVMWLVAVAGLLVLVGRASNRPLGASLAPRLCRGAALLLVLLPLLSGPVLLFWLEVAPLERLHILSTALLSVWVGIGISAVEDQLLGGVASRIRLWRLGLFSLLLIATFVAYPTADLRRSYTVEDWAKNALSSTERGAIIVGTGDQSLFNLVYAQQVLGWRRDVQLVELRLLGQPWYLAQKKRERPGFASRYAGRSISTGGWLQSELDAGVPVYLAGSVLRERMARAFASYPVGPLLRLLPPGSLPPDGQTMAELNIRLFRGFADRGRRPERQHDPYAAQLLESYARCWRFVGNALFQMGDRRGALRALTRGHDWAPWLGVPDWFTPPPRSR